MKQHLSLIFSTIITVLLMSSSGLYAQQPSPENLNPTKDVYSGLGFKFKANFPSNPEVRDESMTSKDGNRYRRMSFLSESNDFMVMVGLIEEVDKKLPTTGDEESYFAPMFEPAIKSLGPAFHLDPQNPERTFLFEGRKTKEIRGLIGNQAALVMRVSITKYGAIVIQAFSKPDNNAQESVENFLSSFSIISGE